MLNRLIFGVKSLIKAGLTATALVLTSPLWISARIAGRLGRSDSPFATCSQIVSVFPGTFGAYLRRAFYVMALERCARNCNIEWGTWFPHPRVTIGRNVYIGTRCTVGMCDIGDDVLIASNVAILSGRRQHNFADPSVPYHAQGRTFSKIRIGNNAWIGNSAVVMADVGDNCIIGAGSVVVDSIPSGSMAAGNPASVKRTLVSNDKP
jgi:virginiamycin A acetyltransferase